jgi:hypothetical protein
MERKKLTLKSLTDTLNEINKKAEERLGEKGPGVFVSSHEMLGVIAEEHHELIHAVEGKKGPEPIYDELLDIAVACVVAMASIKTGGQDWL